MEKTLRRPHPPRRNQYFTCSPDDIIGRVFEGESLDWIDKLPRRQLPRNRLCSLGVEGVREYSKDLHSWDFPNFFLWPKHMQSKHDRLVSDLANHKKEMAKTGKRVECGDLTVFMDCADGNHYFSTWGYNYGSIERAGVNPESLMRFKSTDEAVHAFVKDYQAWDRARARAHHERAAARFARLAA